MPNSPVTPSAPAGPTPPVTPTWAQIVNLFESTPRWVNPANGERSQEAQAKIDHDDQANQQANKQTAWALVFLIVKGTFLLLMIWHAAPLAKTKTLNTTAARDALIEDVRNDLFNDVTNEARDKLIQEVRDLVYNDVMGSTVTSPDQRLMMVGTNTAKEVVTTRWVQRTNKGVGDGGYGKVYGGLHETLFSWEKIVFDDNWAGISNGKRKEAIKQEWIKAFGKMDVAGVTKKRSATIGEVTSSPNKKIKLIDVESIIRSWMRGGVLSSKYLERVGKDLRGRKGLKHAPSDLLRDIAEYRSTLGPTVSVFGFWGWWRFAKDNSRKEIAAEMEGKKYLYGDEDEESKVEESVASEVDGGAAGDGGADGAGEVEAEIQRSFTDLFMPKEHQERMRATSSMWDSARKELASLQG
ncbi:uncharacterized protein J4E88_008626 [Alternaria novae-zelandiae]|uniref:uncharacterized protein n=1 Tax=Alternaria novae-zelandiae TaxID=430562 RepID=UPI0020C33E72|nr:uncharacterized protein J4E88_008626 [Alternaria novae-zelandiae]KAI4673571.1 hypothetical protein J4E88_008626 [Alternaria novae-zelandiae]